MIYMYKYKYINNMDWENMSMYCESIGRPKLYYKYDIYIYMGLQIDSESNGLMAIHGHGLVCLCSRKCRSNCLVQET